MVRSPALCGSRARYLVPCTAIVLLGCAASTSAGAPGPADRLATLTRAQRSAELELYAAESARRAGARVRHAARTPAAGTRCEACAHEAPRRRRPQLARRNQPAGREPAAPALCRGRCRPDRGPARRAIAAGDARRARRARAYDARQPRHRGRASRPLAHAPHPARASRPGTAAAQRRRASGRSGSRSERASGGLAACHACWHRAPSGCHPHPSRCHRGPGRGRSARLRPHRAEERVRSVSGRGAAAPRPRRRPPRRARASWSSTRWRTTCRAGRPAGFRSAWV